jgi:hypothetical protein
VLALDAWQRSLFFAVGFGVKGWTPPITEKFYRYPKYYFAQND